MCTCIKHFTYLVTGTVSPRGNFLCVIKGDQVIPKIMVSILKNILLPKNSAFMKFLVQSCKILVGPVLSCKVLPCSVYCALPEVWNFSFSSVILCKISENWPKNHDFCHFFDPKVCKSTWPPHLAQCALPEVWNFLFSSVILFKISENWPKNHDFCHFFDLKVCKSTWPPIWPNVQCRSLCLSLVLVLMWQSKEVWKHNYSNIKIKIFANFRI